MPIRTRGEGTGFFSKVLAREGVRIREDVRQIMKDFLALEITNMIRESKQLLI